MSFENPDARTIQALTELNYDENFKLVRKWFDAMQNSVSRDLCITEKEVPLRQKQGAAQLLTHLVTNIEQAQANHKKIRDRNYND